MNSESRLAIRMKYRIAALADAASVADMMRRPVANAKPSWDGRRSKRGNPEAERSCIKNPEMPPGLP
ncbi:hypothetical protein RM96_31365 [Cupriavidus sp. IDO]|nr:hypothetical protein RM96_31365 [Cupriavidus sp. IDO]